GARLDRRAADDAARTVSLDVIGLAEADAQPDDFGAAQFRGRKLRLARGVVAGVDLRACRVGDDAAVRCDEIGRLAAGQDGEAVRRAVVDGDAEIARVRRYDEIARPRDVARAVGAVLRGGCGGDLIARERGGSSVRR